MIINNILYAYSSNKTLYWHFCLKCLYYTVINLLQLLDLSIACYMWHIIVYIYVVSPFLGFLSSFLRRIRPLKTQKSYKYVTFEFKQKYVLIMNNSLYALIIFIFRHYWHFYFSRISTVISLLKLLNLCTVCCIFNIKVYIYVVSPFLVKFSNAM